MLDSEEDKEDNEDHGQDDGDDHHHPAVNHASWTFFPIADNIIRFYILDFHFPNVCVLVKPLAMSDCVYWLQHTSILVGFVRQGGINMVGW